LQKVIIQSTREVAIAITHAEKERPGVGTIWR
jgi:hypothetical protein